MPAKNNNALERQAGELIQQAEQAIRQEITDSAPLLKALQSLSQSLYYEGELDCSRRLVDSAKALARKHARDLLAKPRLDENTTLELAKSLKGLYEHSLARELLAKLTEQGPSELLKDKVAQQLSLNTYKDDELSRDIRYDEALAILGSIGLRSPNCRDPETLGQGGAIYKRKFERSGQIEDLRTALYFYSRGWAENPKADMGYCGVNAAYILDLLAHRARIAAAREKTVDTESAGLKARARALREDLREELPELAKEKDRQYPTSNQWWYLITMAEVAFGLERWEEARRWLKLARISDHVEWERQTAAKQLVTIARLGGHAPPGDNDPPPSWGEPWKTLAVLLGDDARAAFECFRGKVGLALSGGGFRASFFHLGVLARLAEVDALRTVEVLSTVSGGSIIGAHYYLALRKLLQSKTDADLTRRDYIDLVDRVSRQFFAGVSENLRVRAVSSLWANLRILFEQGYGRSNRMGELYESYLFDKVEKYRPPAAPRCCAPAMRPLHGLLIHPLSKNPGSEAASLDESFKPKFSNWRRRCKVPNLLLNATSLNSGHNWHFTASWMGEPPGLMGQDIDMNERYRRLYYWQAPTEILKNYPLGYAVAASAGVPALFDPLELKGLYPGRTIRLVDGGVHDNQGIAGLLDESCDLILCSDASGQMDDQDSPASSALSVFYRSDSILQDRVREAQYQDLAARAENQALQGLFFIHLKQELRTDPIDWIECDNPGSPSKGDRLTSYGIDRTLQRRLAEIRTDLDTFTEVEAYALMASGYLMAKHQLGELNRKYRETNPSGAWADFDIDAPEREWVFSPIVSILGADPEGSDRKARDLELQLSVSKKLFGKAWLLIPTLKLTGLALALALLVLLVVLLCLYWGASFTLVLGVGAIATTGVLALMGALLPFGKYIQPLDTLKKWLGLAVLATFGWVAANAHLAFFDRWFKERGKLDRLLKLPGD